MIITDENSRTYATLSYALVMLVVGLPVWWHTTDVERAPLPFDRIEEMNQETLKQTVPITIVSIKSGSVQDITNCISGNAKQHCLLYMLLVKFQITFCNHTFNYLMAFRFFFIQL